MKLKLLITPFLLVMLVIFAIWVIYPKAMEVAGEYKKLQTARAKVADLEDKKEKISLLSADIDSQSAAKEELLAYVPETGHEDEILKNVSMIAGQSGVSIYKLSISRKKGAQAGDAIQDATLISAPNLNDPDSEQFAMVKQDPIAIETKVGVVGTYPKIREFLDKLTKIKRYNNLVSISLSRVEATEENANPENLQGDIIVNFSYLEKIKSVAGIDNRILSTGALDMKDIIDKINNFSISKVTIESQGRSNPFLLQ